MHYLRGYRTLRDDPSWTSKVLVGWVFMLSSLVIPVLGQVAVAGWGVYALRWGVARELARREGRDRQDLQGAPPLAFDMDLIGKLMGPGFKAFIVRLVWTLPIVFLVVGTLACVWLAAAVAAGALAESSGNRDLGGALGCLAIGSMVLLLPLVFLAQVPATFAAMRVELTDDLGEGLKFGEVMAMTRALFGPAALGVLLQSLVNFGLALVGFILCYFPAFAVTVVATYASADLQAQLYLRWLDQGGAPLARLADPVIPARAPTMRGQPPSGGGLQSGVLPTGGAGGAPLGPSPAGSPGGGSAAGGGGWGGPSRGSG
jgi:hypothetical protein